MARARVRLCMKAARRSNQPTKLDKANLKTMALENLRQELRNHVEGLELDGNVAPEDEWRGFKNAVTDASQEERRRAFSLVKRLRWQSKHAWRGFNVCQITGTWGDKQRWRYKGSETLT